MVNGLVFARELLTVGNELAVVPVNYQQLDTSQEDEWGGVDRDGERISRGHSADGEAWLRAGKRCLRLSDLVYVGPTVSSAIS
jgi:hypothetical protein